MDSFDSLWIRTGGGERLWDVAVNGGSEGVTVSNTHGWVAPMQNPDQSDGTHVCHIANGVPTYGDP